MSTKSKSRGFSLLELAVVLGISGLMVGYMLDASFSAKTRVDVECVRQLKAKLGTIRENIERFARKNDRLPLPARRNVAQDDPLYGRESSAAGITQAGGVSFGAVPFQALGLSQTYGEDCWGNKLTYVVTTALTTSSSSGGFLDRNVNGNIMVKRSATLTNTTTAGYALISHGEDQLGAVKLNYAGGGAGWCAGIDIKQYNCVANAALLADADYNTGKDAGAAYFDDIIITSGKPQIIQESYYAFGWGANTSSADHDALIGEGYEVYIAEPNKINSALSFTKISVKGGGTSGYGCGLTAAGAAYCWGANEYGQLGDGTTISRTTPTAVSGGLTFASISVGAYHACGITSANVAYCWGRNDTGQLGDGTTNQRLTPTAVNTVNTYSAIAASSYHTCAIRLVGGTAECWGNNANGRLGDNTTVQKLVPTPVHYGRAYTAIAVGDAHSCAIRSVGSTAECWGNNGSGRLGNNSTTQSLIPVASGAFTYTAITAGERHTCAIRSTGAPYCWGYNGDGQLGDNTTAEKRVPTVVSGGLTVASISAGSSVSCALTTAGVAYCWGASAYGQIGDGTASWSYIPKAVIGGKVFADITVGSTHACARTAANATYCWGSNNKGQLGNGQTSSYNLVSKPAHGGLKFTDVSGYYSHSCGLTASGAAYCWGMNMTGALGDGTTINRTTPTAVSGGLTFTALKVGGSYTCGLTTAGAAYCWGLNGQGQLGDGTNNDTSVPVAVSGGLTFASVYTGNTHTCGLTSAGAAYCWGENGAGELGDGTTNATNTPVAVSGGLTFADLALGQNYSCGITTAGAAYCWGTNWSGQLGNNTTTDSTVPVAVNGGLTFTSINSGNYSVCGVTTTGAGYCWGGNPSGVLGDGTTTERHEPTLISGGLTFSEIVMEGNGEHTCGLTTSGTAYCWGANTLGQLGDGTTTVSLVPKAVTLVTSPAKLRVGYETTYALTNNVTSCTDLLSSGTVPTGVTYYLYQSAAPVGACAAEYRTCTAGAWNGSYTQQTCTPGCDTRTVNWGAAPTCSAVAPALVGGGSTIVNSTSGGAGSVTVNCSTSGVVTLTGPSCS